MPESNDHPPCFGSWEKVFPESRDGLRAVSPDCLGSCNQVHACLKEAAGTRQAMEMRAERMAAMESGRGRGLFGFINRWSELKSMRQASNTKKTK